MQESKLLMDSEMTEGDIRSSHTLNEMRREVRMIAWTGTVRSHSPERRLES